MSIETTCGSFRSGDQNDRAERDLKKSVDTLEDGIQWLGHTTYLISRATVQSVGLDETASFTVPGAGGVSMEIGLIGHKEGFILEARIGTSKITETKDLFRFVGISEYDIAERLLGANNDNLNKEDKSIPGIVNNVLNASE